MPELAVRTEVLTELRRARCHSEFPEGTKNL
jgi:hypothetical protein